MTDHALYRHYNADGRLLYVGITNDPGQRWKGHKAKAWWHEVTNTKIERFPDRAAVLTAERKAIETEKPWWNIQSNGDIVAYREQLEQASEAVGQRWFHKAMSAGFIRGLGESSRAAFLWTRDAQLHDYTLNGPPDGWVPIPKRISARYRAGSQESHWAHHGISAAYILIDTADEYDVEMTDLLREVSFTEQDLEVDPKRKSADW